MRHKAIICDIDNCLIDTSKIESTIISNNLTDADMFDFFEDKANDMQWVIKVTPLFQLLKFYYNSDYEIILLTARSKKIQGETYKFLTSGLPRLPKEIIIVSRGLDEEGIPDEILKANKLKSLLEDYDIEVAIDDKSKNCKMFKENGIFTVQVIL